jgi:1-acyl-sn-glycerol-3-phosphate acyltransferase
MPAEVAGLVARYSRAAFGSFDLFFRPWRASRLTTAPIMGLPAELPAGRPLLLVANHTSWWDGFLVRDVHLALRRTAPMYTVMNRAELERLPFFRLLGAVPLEVGSSSSLLRLLRCLRTAVRARPYSSVVYFPQGRIWPAWKRPLGFLGGVELVTRALAPCCILPIGIHIESLNHARPTAFVSVGPVISYPEQQATSQVLEDAVSAQLDTLAALLARHGEASVDHIRLSMEAV